MGIRKEARGVGGIFFDDLDAGTAGYDVEQVGPFLVAVLRWSAQLQSVRGQVEHTGVSVAVFCWSFRWPPCCGCWSSN